MAPETDPYTLWLAANKRQSSMEAYKEWFATSEGKAYNAAQERERHLKRCCAECLEKGIESELRYVCTINMGDDEGRGSESLYQCPECKSVVTRD